MWLWSRRTIVWLITSGQRAAFPGAGDAQKHPALSMNPAPASLTARATARFVRVVVFRGAGLQVRIVAPLASRHSTAFVLVPIGSPRTTTRTDDRVNAATAAPTPFAAS